MYNKTPNHQLNPSILTRILGFIIGLVHLSSVLYSNTSKSERVRCPGLLLTECFPPICSLQKQPYTVRFQLTSTIQVFWRQTKQKRGRLPNKVASWEPTLQFLMPVESDMGMRKLLAPISPLMVIAIMVNRWKCHTNTR